MIIALAAGASLALAFERLRIPGGLIIGSMIGSATVTIFRARASIELPRPVVTAAFIIIGAAIGTTITRDGLAQFRTVAAGALMSAVAIIIFGVFLAVVLTRVGLAPDGVVLATSPGALSVMAAAGAELGVGVHVTVFHTVRIVLVILSLPLLTRLTERIV